MTRVAPLLLGVLFAACGEKNGTPEPREPDAAEAEVRTLLARIEEPEVFERIVALSRAGPLLEATAPDREQATRRLAAVALGEVGGEEAKGRLLELLEEKSDDPVRDGWIHLYAAVGLTELADPGTAIALLLQLSEINANDSLAARAGQNRTGEYFTIDAQLCEALLRLGLFAVEESLVDQLRRRDRIRVGIDANAVLRRTTGIDLPFRYNGSFRDREADAAAWEAALRETRRARYAANPFPADHPEFEREAAKIMGWLRGTSIRHRLAAQKVIRYLGPIALPSLRAELVSEHDRGRSQAALMVGRMNLAAAALNLLPLLKDGYADARAEAVKSLGILDYRPPQVIEAIRPLLKDEDAEVRAQAAAFLGS